MKKNKNTYGIFLSKFPKVIIYIWIKQFYFWKKTKIFMEPLLYCKKATEK